MSAPSGQNPVIEVGTMDALRALNRLLENASRRGRGEAGCGIARRVGGLVRLAPSQQLARGGVRLQRTARGLNLVSLDRVDPFTKLLRLANRLQMFEKGLIRKAICWWHS